MKEIEQAAIDKYGSDPNLYASQRDGFIAGANWQSEQDNWISISTPPEIGERVLFIDNDGDQFIDIHMGEQWPYYTHWQPLPKKPLNK